MNGKTLAGPSSYNTTAADLAVQRNIPQLYNTTSEFSRINTNSLSGLSTTEKNNMLVSTLAAITASTSAGMSPASALASVFGHDRLGNIGGLGLATSQFQLTNEQPASLLPVTTPNSVAENTPLHRDVSLGRPERKGGKIEDIIKRIRDKKTHQ